MSKKTKIAIATVVVVGFVGVITLFSNKNETNKENNKINIVTTVSPLTNIAQDIGGDYVNVQSIYPPGSDPHHYELTAKDMKTVMDADMFIYISDTNSTFAQDLQQSESGNSKTKFINITEEEGFKSKVDPNLYGSGDEVADEAHEGKEDSNYEPKNVIKNPHIWLSPKKLLLVSDVITEKLIAEKPELKTDFEANQAQVNQKLNKLDADLEKFAANQKKPIIVAHDAYGYWTTDYGIEEVGAYGQMHEDEPTSKEIKSFEDTIINENVPVIYYEQNDQNNPVIKMLKDETGCQTAELNNMSTISIEDESIYEILEQNINNLQPLTK